MFESKWSEILINKWQDHDIPGQIDELQRSYRHWFILCAVLALGGMAVMRYSSNYRLIAVGLLLAITGILLIVLLKIWVHIKLSTLRMIWEMQEREKVNKS